MGVRLLSFILLNTVFAAIDGIVTFGVMSLAGIDVLSARLLGALIACAGLCIFQNRWYRQHAFGRLLASSIGCVSIVVSYGIFAMLLSRNPMLQWPMAFLAASLASLLFSSVGYRRAWNRGNRAG